MIRCATHAARKVAVSLGLQFRDAVFGFEEIGEKMQPVFGGIVVVIGDSDLVLSALAEVDDYAVADAALRKEKIILRRWEKVARLALTRQRLKERHGA